MRLSIITINLNNTTGLQKTIESVVTQTFTDYEYIIIDGGSTDGSVDIIKQYADKITYWVSEPDKGIYNAMNKGILQAKGEYCQFLNSGDRLFDSNTLRSVFDKNLKDDIITGNTILINKNKQEINKGIASLKQKITLGDMLESTLSHPSTFIKKYLFKKFGLYNEQYEIISDWIFFLITIGLNNVNVKYIDINIATFNLEGISSKNIAKLRQEKADAIVKTITPNILRDYQEYFSLKKKYEGIAKYKSIISLINTLNYFNLSLNKLISLTNKLLQRFHSFFQK